MEYWPEEEAATWDELIGRMNQKLQMPGMDQRVDRAHQDPDRLLTTGIRTPVGIKVFGQDLIEAVGERLEALLAKIAGTRSVLYERSLGGTYVDVALTVKREAVGRFGLQIPDLNTVIQQSIGGEPITTTVEGRERYTVNVRYKEDFRSTPERLRKVLVPLRARAGANEMSTSIWNPGRDVGGNVNEAKSAVKRAQSNDELSVGQLLGVKSAAPSRGARSWRVGRRAGGGWGARPSLESGRAAASAVVAASSHRMAPPHRGQVSRSTCQTCRSSHAQRRRPPGSHRNGRKKVGYLESSTAGSRSAAPRRRVGLRAERA